VIAVEVEAEGVDRLVAKGRRRGHAGIGVDCHRHDRGPGLAWKEIEIADIYPGIFAGGWGIEMM
jgi:hypothetical protein